MLLKQLTACIVVAFFVGVYADDITGSDRIALLERQVEALIQARETDRQKISELKKDLKDITALVVKKGHGVSTRQAYQNTGIGFTTCVSVADLVNLGVHQTVVFDHIITNAGGAYHNSTGVFTAPTQGLYAFHLSAMSKPNQYMPYQLMKDGTYVDNMLTDGRGDSSWESASEMWVLKLTRGSEVWIQTQNAGELHGHCHTMFSGFLLTETE